MAYSYLPAIDSDSVNPMRIEISAATHDDLKRLIDVYSSPDLKTNTDEAQWFVRCYLDYHHVVVARVEGHIEGACFWRIEGERYCGLGWIENLWVEEGSRRLGLAERLMRAAIEDMRSFYEENGFRARKAILTTQASKSGARALYEKLGFRCMAEFENMYEPDDTDLLYMLDL